MHTHIHTYVHTYTHTQVGDLAEVMYLAVQTAEEKSKWVEAFRKGA